jgi:hypothetical protein
MIHFHPRGFFKSPRMNRKQKMGGWDKPFQKGVYFMGVNATPTCLEG